MTVKEVEEATGVPASYIVESLGLPVSISVDEKLGVLKKKQGVEVKDVRVIVKRYK